MKKFILFMALIHFQLLLIGQQTQKLVVKIHPPDSYVKINDSVIEVKKEKDPFTLELNPGIYPIEIWSPRYNLFKDTIIIENKINYYSKGLIEQSPLFKDFKKEYRKYKSKKIRRQVASGWLVAGNLAGLWYVVDGRANRKMSRLQDRAETLRVTHLNTASESNLANNRIEYEKIQSDFKSTRRNLYLRRGIGIPLVALSGLLSRKYLKRMWSKKIIPPTFEGEKNPFVLKDVEIETSGYLCNLRFKFEF